MHKLLCLSDTRRTAQYWQELSIRLWQELSDRLWQKQVTLDAGYIVRDDITLVCIYEVTVTLKMWTR